MMNITELPLPPAVFDVFKAEEIMALYPPQEEAIKKVFEGKNLVLAMPTASGKSLVAYLAILRGYLKGMKSVYIVPLISLAMEKYEDMKKFAFLGMKINLAIGDYDTTPEMIKNADVLIATAEKFDSITRHDFYYLYNLGVVVVDEVHLLTDLVRGPTLEMILTKFRHLKTSAQIIALSATIKNYKVLAQWLNAEYVYSEFRPVPLKIGIFEPYSDLLKFNDGTILDMPADRVIIGNLVKRALQQDGQLLIFVNTRHRAEVLAERLKTIVPMQSATAPEYITGVDTNVYDLKIKELVQYGVCFHHAGLSSTQRKAVEKMFKARQIKILVATPTLAAGVNLPSRTVIIRDITRYSGGRSVPIPYLEINQMLGRAGRPKYDTYGEAIVVSTKPDLDFDVLNEIESIHSGLDSLKSLRTHVLGLIASGLVSTDSEISEFFTHSFYGQIQDTETLKMRISYIIQFLEENELIVYSRNKIKATLFGKRVSDLYIDPLTGLNFKKAYSYKFDKLVVLYTIADAGEMIPLFCKKTEIPAVEQLIYKKISEHCKFFENEEINFSSLKTANMLLDWINGLSTDALIQKYSIGPGDIHLRVEIAEWLLFAYFELGKVEKYPYLEEVKELWNRVKYGVPSELLAIVTLKGIGRVRARRLYDYGYRDLVSLKSAKIEDLARIPGIGDTIAKSIKAQLSHKNIVQFKHT